MQNGLMLFGWAWPAHMLSWSLSSNLCGTVCSSLLHTLHAPPRGRWDGDNGPEQSDFVAVRNLLAATPRSVRRFVLTTSAGVERQGKFPFVILNLFGALWLLLGCIM